MLDGGWTFSHNPGFCRLKMNQRPSIIAGCWGVHFWHWIQFSIGIRGVKFPILATSISRPRFWNPKKLKKKLWLFLKKIENKSEKVFLFLCFGNLFYYEKNLKQLKNGIPLWFVFDFFFTDATLKNLISADFCSGNCFREIGFNRFFSNTNSQEKPSGFFRVFQN